MNQSARWRLWLSLQICDSGFTVTSTCCGVAVDAFDGGGCIPRLRYQTNAAAASTATSTQPPSERPIARPRLASELLGALTPTPGSSGEAGGGGGRLGGKAGVGGAAGGAGGGAGSSMTKPGPFHSVDGWFHSWTRTSEKSASKLPDSVRLPATTMLAACWYAEGKHPSVQHRATVWGMCGQHTELAMFS